MAETLLPCPFCGGEAHVLSEETHNGGRKFRVGCYDPCCSGAAFEGAVFFDRSEAVTAWNRRAERTARIVVSHGIHGPEPRFPGDVWTMHHVCSACGGAVDGGDRYCRHCGARVAREGI